MIIKPLRDKKTKKLLSNREICKRAYNTLNDLYESEDVDKKKIAIEICGSQSNLEQTLAFLKPIAEAPNDEEGNRILNQGLIPTPQKNVK
jgi:hypothetical protein